MEPIRNQDLFPLVVLLALVMVVAIQLLSHVPLFVVMDCSTPALHYPSLSFTISWSFLKLMSVESMMPWLVMV